MEKRALGAHGPKVNPIGLGCMGMSDFYGPAEDEVSIGVIHHALDRGVNFFDTADMYGTGKNEELLGKALAGRRDEAVVATKFAVIRGEDGSFRGISGKAEYVKSACEASLRRLGIDVIDLYYQHRVDPQVPIEETVGAMAELVREGKVRHLGLSEAAPATIRRAAKVHPIAALQTEYSLWTREPEDDLLDLCAELSIAFVAYSPLGRGFLTGQIKSIDDLAPDDYRRRAPRFSGENFEKNLELVRAVEALAKEKGATPAQLALAWLLARAPHIVTIPGTRKKSRLDENLGALDLALTPADLEALDGIVPKGAAAGERYDRGGMASVNG
jgi:aryl-alcohol dehydrogenase-like predicted oxidoreductase